MDLHATGAEPEQPQRPSLSLLFALTGFRVSSFDVTCPLLWSFLVFTLASGVLFLMWSWGACPPAEDSHFIPPNLQPQCQTAPCWERQSLVKATATWVAHIICFPHHLLPSPFPTQSKCHSRWCAWPFPAEGPLVPYPNPFGAGDAWSGDSCLPVVPLACVPRVFAQALAPTWHPWAGRSTQSPLDLVLEQSVWGKSINWYLSDRLSHFMGFFEWASLLG